MIKNDLQFEVTKTQVRRFDAALTAVHANDVPENTDPIIWKAYLEGMTSQRNTLERELEEYLLLKVKVDSI